MQQCNFMQTDALQVLVAGTSEQVNNAIKAAEPYKEQLQERGVVVVPLPIFEDSDSANDQSTALEPGDLK